jgi:hypothetical protein
MERRVCMNKTAEERTCFIIMPISTPNESLQLYEGDADHFRHVLEYLIAPAVTEFGYRPIPPLSKGAQLIHADIVANLATADVVLCDMSTLNANVFFELGVRTTLNKAVCLMVDDKTTGVPFDTSIMNRISYPAQLRPWNITDARARLVQHLRESTAGQDTSNTLWRYFGIAGSGSPPADTATQDEKLAIILQQLERMATRQSLPVSTALDRPELDYTNIHFDTPQDFQKALQVMPDFLASRLPTKDGGCVPVAIKGTYLEIQGDCDHTATSKFFKEHGIAARPYSRP